MTDDKILKLDFRKQFLKLKLKNMEEVYSVLSSKLNFSVIESDKNRYKDEILYLLDALAKISWEIHDDIDYMEAVTTGRDLSKSPSDDVPF